MAQTKKKRSRKRRGTQGGSVDNRRRQRPRTRAEAKSQAQRSRGARSVADRPPTWRSATIRGIIAAVVFVLLLLLVLGRGAGEALIFGAFMLALYIPAGYYMDTLMWRRRERARIRAGK